MKLLPQPQKLILREEKFYMDYNTVLMIAPDCTDPVFSYAVLLQETILQWCGFEPAIRKGVPRPGDIQITLTPSLSPGQHTIVIQEDGVQISGSGEEALLHGVQTLRQIVMQAGCILPALEILDYPAIPNRGFFHDVSRGRVPHLSELKRLADQACSYKLNQLQLYVEHTYLFRDFSEVYRDETPLTAEEILEFDRYCKERHIDLVPSLSSFGHLYMLLRTYSYAEFCERRDEPYRPFSFSDRMHQHTINVSHQDALPLIKGMLKEYMALFSSRYFNLCADETFDLCIEKSKHLAEGKDVKDIYTDYLSELCSFTVENGKIPMFWGDIIWGYPEKIKRLPEECICLYWGYAHNQVEQPAKVLAEAGIKQYLCPGVGGWNQFVNTFHNAYKNISRMCTYAGRYHADGVLNTDWGDFGHINQPVFSMPGLIMGAAFAWNTEILEFDEIMRRISLLEFCDPSMQFALTASKIAGKDTFSWHDVIKYYEQRKEEFLVGESAVPYTQANAGLASIRRELAGLVCQMDSSTRSLHQNYMLGIDSIIVWNKVKPALAKKLHGFGKDTQDPSVVASELEHWFMRFKTEWRKVSREGDLRHIAEVVFWYADQLRK